MSSKRMCVYIRIAVLAVALCGIVLAVFAVPSWFRNPSYFLPWVIFIALSLLPVFAVLCIVWLCAGAVERQEVFTLKTAKYIDLSGKLLFADSAFFFIGNLVLLLFKKNDHSIILVACAICILALALGLICHVLAHYVRRATILQEEADSTI